MSGITLLLFFTLCFAICYFVYFTIETFQCQGTFTVPKCESNQDDETIDRPVATGEFTSLVGENTVCQDPVMRHESSHMIPNDDIQVGEKVYVLYNNQYYPARIARVYKKNDASAVTESSILYSKRSSPHISSFITRPNPLFHHSQPLHYDEHMYQQWTLQQPSMSMQPSNVQKQLMPVHADGDWVDVIFQDNTLNMERMHSSVQDMRFSVQRDIVRLPQPNLIDQCATTCLNQNPNAWGIETGSCLEKTCKCTCIMPLDSTSICDKTHTMTPVELQEALRTQTHTDLHQVDERKRMQNRLHQRLTKTCTTHGQQLPVSFPCQDTGTERQTTGTENASCCPHRCDGYTGQEKEMCMNPDKLKDYLNNMPPIYSVGKGMCLESDSNNGTITCPNKKDIPCYKRLRSDCRTIQESDFYKCEYHTNDIHNEYDEYATGCYDKSKCMFHDSAQSCEQDKVCMWRKDASYCVEKKHCPSECVTPPNQNAESCTNNPFCRWTGTKCIQQNVIDTDEFKAMMNTPSTKTNTILSSSFPTIDTHALQSNQAEYSTSKLSDILSMIGK